MANNQDRGSTGRARETSKSNIWFNPSSYTNLTSAMKDFAWSIKAGIRVCCPAAVYSYDRETHRAQVVPLIKYAYRDQDVEYLLNDAISVTVFQFCHGGFVCDAPLYRGDTGWIISSDWNTGLLKQKDSLQTSVLSQDRGEKVVEEEYQVKPGTFDLHVLSEGFFIPDCWGSFDPSKFKEHSGDIGDDAFVIGTSVPTTDSHQDGESSYVQNPSCSMAFSRDGKVLLSTHSGDGEKSVAKISLTGDGITISHSKGDSDSASVRISDGIVYIDAKEIKLSGKIDLGSDVSMLGSKVEKGEIAESPAFVPVD